MTARAARFRIRGKVQGVSFRAGTRGQAVHLGLCGYARNLDDGSVEVLAIGDPAGIDALAQWLQHGPAHAQVDSVERDVVMMDAAPQDGFTVQ